MMGRKLRGSGYTVKGPRKRLISSTMRAVMSDPWWFKYGWSVVRPKSTSSCCILSLVKSLHPKRDWVDNDMHEKWRMQRDGQIFTRRGESGNEIGITGFDTTTTSAAAFVHQDLIFCCASRLKAASSWKWCKARTSLNVLRFPCSIH